VNGATVRTSDRWRAIRGGAAERLAECRGTAPGVHARHVQRGAVREAIAERRVELHEVEGLVETGAGLVEQVAVDRRQREQRRAGVEDEAVTLDAPELAAVGRCLLHHGDVMTLHCQARGDSHPAHACADHHHPCHGRRA